jgi:hypothetical protein
MAGYSGQGDVGKGVSSVDCRTSPILLGRFCLEVGQWVYCVGCCQELLTPRRPLRLPSRISHQRRAPEAGGATGLSPAFQRPVPSNLGVALTSTAFGLTAQTGAGDAEEPSNR